MSNISKQDAALNQLLNAPKYLCEHKSYKNCIHHEYGGPDESVKTDASWLEVKTNINIPTYQTQNKSHK